jgi:nucleoside 2-deoxyribosyltransferase
MKIYVIGSNSAMHEMVEAKNNLCDLEYDGRISEDYEKLVRGEKPELLERIADGEHAQVKIDNNYHKYNFKNIKDSDAVLVVNEPKDGIKNYIGGNTLMEMGQAYVLDKKVFIYYDVPKKVPYVDEIKSLEPVCLHGDIENISKYA